MLYCPSCGSEYGDDSSECAACHVPLTPEAPVSSPDPGEWVTVFRGTGVQVRSVEAGLLALGFQVVRLPGESVELFPIEASRGTELGLHELAVPLEEHTERQHEIEAVTRAGESRDEDPEAALEAEEDYDVRGCPACLLYFHETYAQCPGCGAELVPAVECFEEGQSTPDRVILAHGSETEVKMVAGRLQAAGLDGQASAVEDWPVSVVDVPWQELTDRTAEVETALTAP